MSFHLYPQFLSSSLSTTSLPHPSWADRLNFLHRPPGAFLTASTVACKMSASAQRALDYLQSQPGTTFSKLYRQPSTALAIFRRMLPHLAKTIVMAMLYMPAPMLMDDLDVWVRPETASVGAKERALQTLQNLRIMSQDADAATRKWTCVLSPAFAKSLRAALTGSGSHNSFGVPCSETDKSPVSIDFLDAFARKQWETILYYVVGGANPSLSSGVDVANGTKSLLQAGLFVVVRGKQRSITTAGFEFVLQDVNAQIWALLIQYLKMCSSDELKMDEVDVLSFLFTLGSLELGTSYSTSNLTQTQLQMLDDLTDFGLIYRRSSSSDRYYPTRLATTLTSDAPALPNSTLLQTTIGNTDPKSSQVNSKGYLILETNYRLYAYTSSPLLISILSLFAQLQTRYPNLTTARLTKSSIQHAISTGITATQIISYLQSHAHPVMLRNFPVLPPTVTDQIRLWEIEGERMQSSKGFYIKDVDGREYQAAVEYANTLGVLVKRFDEKRTFFVTNMEQIQKWFKTQVEKKKALREQGILSQNQAGTSKSSVA